MAEAKRVVGKCTGYIYGTQNWTIVSFPVSHREEAGWIHFLLLSGFQSTFLSAEASQALGLEQKESMVTIAGRSSGIFRSPPIPSSHLTSTTLRQIFLLFPHKSSPLAPDLQEWKDYQSVHRH
ncbi:hypothetical protein B9Z19DRAFT_1133755 [Tuber borchii]|uniref:Uncharacterized protein n=1 Tax=Tuber borchii TaxID=42251 RepID=A0A2T6ZFB9_TUBBO|nr:hypothetical protein B9Z19DRAFT_1133755 [Tuber borchii]